MLERTAVDVRVPMPAADPKFIDFVGEKNHQVRRRLDDVYAPAVSGRRIWHDLADTLQGKFGHHS